MTYNYDEFMNTFAGVTPEYACGGKAKKSKKACGGVKVKLSQKGGKAKTPKTPETNEDVLPERGMQPFKPEDYQLPDSTNRSLKVTVRPDQKSFKKPIDKKKYIPKGQTGIDTGDVVSFMTIPFPRKKIEPKNITKNVGNYSDYSEGRGNFVVPKTLMGNGYNFTEKVPLKQLASTQRIFYNNRIPGTVVVTPDGSYGIEFDKYPEFNDPNNPGLFDWTNGTDVFEPEYDYLRNSDYIKARKLAKAIAD